MNAEQLAREIRQALEDVSVGADVCDGTGKKTMRRVVVLDEAMKAIAARLAPLVSDAELLSNAIININEYHMQLRPDLIDAARRHQHESEATHE